MADLNELSTALLQLLQNRDWDGTQVNPIVREMAEATQVASDEVRNTVYDRLVTFLGNAPFQEAGIVALCAGTVVEQGSDPEPLLETLVTRLPDVLKGASWFAQAVLDASPEEPPEDAPDAGMWVGPHPVPSELFERLRLQDHDAVGAWNTLTFWCLPTIACATASVAGLRRLIPLRDDLEPLDGLAEGPSFLRTAALLPLNETWTVIHRPSMSAFRIGVHGVATNFELHTLLAAALAPHLRLEGPPAEVLACLRGQADRHAQVSCITHFELRDGLGDAVWNERRPADVPELDGSRVLVLETPTIHGRWNTSRTFAHLPTGMPDVVVRAPLGDASALLGALSSP